MEKRYIPLENIKGEQLQIEIDQSDGNSRDPRGIYIYIRPVEVTPRPGGYNSICYAVFDERAITILLEQNKRKNQKKLDAYMQRMNATEESELVQLYKEKNISGIKSLFINI